MSCDIPSDFRNVLTLNALEKRVSVSYIIGSEDCPMATSYMSAAVSSVSISTGA